MEIAGEIVSLTEGLRQTGTKLFFQKLSSMLTNLKGLGLDGGRYSCPGTRQAAFETAWDCEEIRAE